MSKTKKEHYVPRCYLKNFIDVNEDRVHVFDKVKLNERKQKIMDVAMENYFYDIDLDKLFKNIDSENIDKLKKDINESLKVDSFEEAKKILENHVEKNYLSIIEGFYSKFLEKLIDRITNANPWYLKNCNALSEKDKIIFSNYIALQFVRTKKMRTDFSQVQEQFFKVSIQKGFFGEGFENCDIKIDKEVAKLNHIQMILDEKNTTNYAKSFHKHIWVIYYNKTNTPFYTSDNPIAIVPHKFDGLKSYGGISSDEIEILFPVSSNILIGMYDREFYENDFKDKQLFIFDNTKENEAFVEYFNVQQVVSSSRCLFSSTKDFSIARKICSDNPYLQNESSRITVT